MHGFYSYEVPAIVGHDFYLEATITDIPPSQNQIGVKSVSITTPSTIADMPTGAPATATPTALLWPLLYVDNSSSSYSTVTSGSWSGWCSKASITPIVPPVIPPCKPPCKPPTPPTPPTPPGPCIPLAFEIAGTVWLDNLTGKESLANGIMDSTEPGIPNVEVYLYRVDRTDPIAYALTDTNGKYSFGYVRVGYDYYVQFVYDGMTYKSTNYLNTPMTQASGTDTPAVNDLYKNNTDNYLNASQAVEDIAQRTLFNSKFYTITDNMATGIDGITKTPLSYNVISTPTGQVSTLITTDANGIALPEFKMSSSTSTTGLYYPLNDEYNVDKTDKNLVKVGNDYYYIKTYAGTKDVNLGLVKREQGDFAVKNDIYQTILTMKNDVITYKYDTKNTDNSTFDVATRTKTYYDQIYTQAVNPDDYTWRYDTSYGKYSDISKAVYDQSDELNIYLEYKFLIRNQDTLQFGYVKDLINYFDKDLEYSTSYDFTPITSWIETNPADGDGSYKQEIKWEYTTGQNGGNALHTTDLQNIPLVSGQTLEVHLILKVKKDASRAVILNPDTSQYYTDVLEITSYGFNEGVIDKDSNPGNCIVGNTSTYEDDTDSAPNMKILLDPNYLLGNTISGYVWEDLKDAEDTEDNNIFTGNGKIDTSEKKIGNVKVELIEVLQNEKTGKEIELVVRDAIRTGDSIKVVNPVTGATTNYNVADGQYMFANLPTGTYKVKFTYGDGTQLEKDVTYNGQDYKSVSTDTLKQQYNNTPMEVMLLLDTSKTMTFNNRLATYTDSAKQFIDTLYNEVQKVKVGVSLYSEPSSSGSANTGLKDKPSELSLIQTLNQAGVNTGGSLATAINNAISTFSKGSTPKVILIFSDGYSTQSDDDKKAIAAAGKAGIKVISVICSIDDWSISTFGTSGTPTSGQLYYITDKDIKYYVTEVALEDTLHEIEKTLPNLTDAKDVQDVYNVDPTSVVGDIYSRKRNIDYTKVMTNANGAIVNGVNTTNLAAFAQNTQMTAITPKRTITLSNNNDRSSEVNLGLIERPKMELQIKEEVVGIQIKLSNGQTIIDTEKGMTQNVQYIPNDKYAIYMDNEIMQGATLTAKYKITVVNNGQVDTLGEYFDYDMFDPAAVALYTGTAPTEVGTIYSYFDNFMFRAEDNSKWQIEENSVKLNTMNFANGKITSPSAFIKNGKAFTDEIASIDTKMNNNSAVLLPITAMWEFKNDIPVESDVTDKINNKLAQVSQTTSLKDTELFPVMSKEVQVGNLPTSVSTYLQYSKVLSANDQTDTLKYNTAVEIVERLHDLGRRDYIGVPGDYMPFQAITEYDSAKADGIVILNPLGDGDIDIKTYFGVIIGSIIILASGVIFIKRRVL